MLHSKSVAFFVGLFVFVGVGALFFLAMQVSNLSSFSDSESYHLIAKFENIGGLKVRSPITVAGVRIGRVSSISYDKDRYEAIVEMRIDSEYDTFTTDASANIYTAGLLGEQYISLNPGGADDFLVDGDQLQSAESAIILEEIVSKFLFSKVEESADP